MMKLLLILALLLTGADPATKPADPSAPSSLEVRAFEEFNGANWSSALPLLKKVAQQMQDSGQTQRLGSIEESIRVCEKNLKTPAVSGQAAASANDARKPHPAPKPGETLEISIKDLGNFDYDADNGGNIPDDVKRLSGSNVKMSGFMIPMDQAENISQFALVPSLFSCCFGQPPQVQHTIVVHVPKGKRVGYYPDEISVEGKLTVEEKKEDGFIVSIFEIECSSVKPAAK